MEKKFCRALTVCSIQRVPPTRVGTIFLLLPFAEFGLPGSFEHAIVKCTVVVEVVQSYEKDF